MTSSPPHPIDVGFPPIADAHARTLILGSMPSRQSLRLRQYYAHPRNAFWRIIGSLYRLPEAADYQQRGQALLTQGIALWDVLASCRRPGSLDADIDKDSIVVNDFAAFFEQHPGITRVFFNGARAEAEFERRVVPTLASVRPLRRRLPSTSPANAGLSFEEKLSQWSVIAHTVV